jgi:hypothetical protein
MYIPERCIFDDDILSTALRWQWMHKDRVLKLIKLNVCQYCYMQTIWFSWQRLMIDYLFECCRKNHMLINDLKQCCTLKNYVYEKCVCLDQVLPRDHFVSVFFSWILSNSIKSIFICWINFKGKVTTHVRATRRETALGL